MNKHIDARSIATDLDRIMDEAAHDNTRFIVDRDGRPAIVTMSFADYLRALPAPDWLQDSWTHAREVGLDTMTMDAIDAEIASARAEARHGAAPKTEP